MRRSIALEVDLSGQVYDERGVGSEMVARSLPSRRRLKALAGACTVPCACGFRNAQRPFAVTRTLRGA
jgi:hypothetical protein